jgi:hypothetical protein
MPYLMGGFPDLQSSRAIGEAYADGGADLVELGVPFSDPLADGPVIQAAGTRALAAGATVAGVLEVAAAIAARVPVVLMCYANLVLTRGAEAFAARLAGAGLSGLIVPDLPLEEAPGVLEACDAAGIALVPLVAPTTPDERLARIGARARGFVYTVRHRHDRRAHRAVGRLRRRHRPRPRGHRGADRAGLRHRDARAGGGGRRRGRRRGHHRQPLVRAASEAATPRPRCSSSWRASRRPSIASPPMGLAVATTIGW